ncbi:MAG: (d)CMP kinase [Candidatus Omnitrophica bacterium]|nr:(d)CMP kinase [Candidatus Omnitrophota bacterium]
MPHLKSSFIIAIDGAAGSGKSTTAKALASRLKIPYIDSGAMYRAVTLKALSEKVSLKDKKALVATASRAQIHFEGKHGKVMKVILDGKNVSSAIRVPELTNKVFYVARIPEVRRELVKKQRRLAARHGAVMEGRDIGTVVFPKADYKFFFVAKKELRAQRRRKELESAGHRASLIRVLKEMEARDRSDRTRKEGPLKRAKDAYLIDTTPLTISQTVDRILQIIASNPLNAKPLYRKSGA